MYIYLFDEKSFSSSCTTRTSCAIEIRRSLRLLGLTSVYDRNRTIAFLASVFFVVVIGECFSRVRNTCVIESTATSLTTAARRTYELIRGARASPGYIFSCARIVTTELKGLAEATDYAGKIVSNAT